MQEFAENGAFLWQAVTHGEVVQEFVFVELVRLETPEARNNHQMANAAYGIVVEAVFAITNHFRDRAFFGAWDRAESVEDANELARMAVAGIHGFTYETPQGLMTCLFK